MRTSKPKADDLYPSASLIPTAQRKPTLEQIRQRANDIYAARGGKEGMTLNDWLQAEQELKHENHQH
jgi:hypothetical protein